MTARAHRMKEKMHVMTTRMFMELRKFLDDASDTGGLTLP